MNQETKNRVKELFLQAVDLPEELRETWVRDRAGTDEELLHEVLSLLEHDKSSEPIMPERDIGRLREAIADVVDSGTQENKTEPRIPDRIGDYEVLGLLGAGGMGYVYKARQHNPPRTVALKVIRPDLAGDTNLRRFRLEAQVLARLKHPGIAHIYEAGIAETSTGSPQPYLAMEYVEGRNVKEFIEGQGLSRRRIFELVARICDALHHAHVNGVIHRDLKPANIVVTNEMLPKILDFGVSRLTDTEAPDITSISERGNLIGTVPYMSPEQVSGHSIGLDTRTDIYSLGVVLYELLAGRLPHDLENLSVIEAARKIAEVEPKRIGKVEPELRGDGEIVVSTALAQEREQRYQTAADFARDIRNYLAARPLLAHPPSALYQIRKFTARNKALSASILMIAVALMLGILTSTRFAIMARKAEFEKTRQYEAAVEARQLAEQRQREAQEQSEIAQAVNDFLNEDLLAAVDPTRTADRELTVREAVEAAETRVAEAFGDRPRIEAAIRLTLGTTFRNLGLYDRSIQNLRRAHQLLIDEHGESAKETVGTRLNLARTLAKAGMAEEAESNYRDVLDKTVELYGRNSGETGVTKNDLGLHLVTMGKLEQGIPLLEEALETCRNENGELHESTLAALSNLSLAMYHKGDNERAWRFQHEAYAKQRESLGPDHPNTLNSMMNLGYLADVKGDFETAEKWYEETLERQQRVLGGKHHETLNTLRNLALLYNSWQRYEESVELNKQALEGYTEALGPNHQHTATTLGNLAGSLASLGRFDEAEPKYLRSLDIYIDIFGEDNFATASCMNNIASMYQQMDDHEKAAEMLRRCIGIYTRNMGADHRYTLIASNNLARSLTHSKAFEQAHELLRSTLAAANNAFNEEDKLIWQTHLLIGQAYLAERRFAEAEQELLPVWERNRDRYGVDHKYEQAARKSLARLYEEWDKPEKAARFQSPTIDQP